MFSIIAQVSSNPMSVPDALKRKRSEAFGRSARDGLTADEERAIVSEPWIASLPTSARQAKIISLSRGGFTILSLKASRSGAEGALEL